MSQLFDGFRGRLFRGSQQTEAQLRSAAGPQESPASPFSQTSLRGASSDTQAVLLEEEHLQLALALSVSESVTAPHNATTDEAGTATTTLPAGLGRNVQQACAKHAQQEHAAPAQPDSPLPLDTSSDEALARELQLKLDAELWGSIGSESQRGGLQRQSSGSAQPLPSAPLPPSNTPVATIAAPQPHSPVVPPQRPPVMGTLGLPGNLQPQGLALHGDPICAGCHKPVHPWQGSPADHAVKFQDQRTYHADCHKRTFHPKCSVCANYLPKRADNMICFHSNPIWNSRYCPKHESDGTPRCTACDRLQIHGEDWVAIDDDRHACLECLATVVRNNADCAPLYDDVLSLYASFGMPLPERPPLQLVNNAAMNGADHGGRVDGPIFHTRGLALFEEYRMQRTTWLGSRRTETRWEATAILVLFGLPWLLTGCILAHEVMHVWLRLSGCQRLSPDVEEGLAQLMALLWLERQTPAPRSFEERLAAYLGKQIRDHPSPVYGDGFRAAHDAFQSFDLPAVLAHVRAHGTLPGRPCVAAAY